MSDIALPSRVARVSPLTFALSLAVIAFVIASFTTSGIAPDKLSRGIPALGRLVGQMFPPSVERLEPVLWSLLQTFQMAVAGTILGMASMAAFGAAASYAIGKVFVRHFEKGGSLESFSAEAVKEELKAEFSRAKDKQSSAAT
jgi:ABC-type phosphate/phosphonate transport system permease subunit